MTSAESPGPGELARALRSLRVAAGLRQAEVVARTGLSQARLSRSENGLAGLRPEEVGRLAELYGAAPDRAAVLVSLAREATDEYVDARVVLQRGDTANLQRRFALLEQRSTEVRAFQPVMVLGVLQTPAYAAAVFGTDERDPLVEQRLRRRRALLDDPARRWVLIQTEGSLRWHVRSPALMAEQLDALVELSSQPNLELGVLGWDTPVSIFPASAFHLYDRATVVVGTNDGTAIVRAPHSVSGYRETFEELSSLAAFGSDARAVLRRVGADYRRIADGPP